MQPENVIIQMTENTFEVFCWCLKCGCSWRSNE